MRCNLSGKNFRIMEENMSITDRELLAICNLSNLRMEFANLKQDTETTESYDNKNLSNHTIYLKFKN